MAGTRNLSAIFATIDDTRIDCRLCAAPHGLDRAPCGWRRLFRGGRTLDGGNHGSLLRLRGFDRLLLGNARLRGFAGLAGAQGDEHIVALDSNVIPHVSPGLEDDSTYARLAVLKLDSRHGA